MERVDWRLRHWQKKLGLDHVVIHTERISPFQVADDVRERRSNNPFVGIVRLEEGLAVLLHTRRLRRDDIIHELLHLVYPDWEHEQIVEETERLR